MVHLENLRNIFQRRAILSKEKVLQEKIAYRSIAFEEVQTLRDRIFVRNPFEARYRPLHSYVPFYFAARTPMLHVNKRKGFQKEIVIFEVSLSFLTIQGVYLLMAMQAISSLPNMEEKMSLLHLQLH